VISTAGRSQTRVARGGVLILGGGFAGAHVARRLGRSGATIVNPDNFMLFRPLLPGVAAGSIEPRRATVPLRNMCPSAELVLGSVTGLDAHRRIAHLSTDAGACAIAFADLVVAVGSAQPRPTVPGLVEHAFGLRDLRDAVALRDHVLRQVELADFEPSTASARLTFVIAGSSRTTAEAVAELAGLTTDALRQHPRLRGVRARWLLTDADPKPSCGRALRDRGVELLGGGPLRSVSPTGVELADGHRLATHTVVWCPPVVAHPQLPHLGLPLDPDGRLRVDDTLRVVGVPHVWAVGDCAAAPLQSEAASCREVRYQAQTVAANLRNPPRPHRGQSRSLRATTAATARLTHFARRGVAGSLATRGCYLTQLPFASRRLRVVLDWLTAALICRDIAELSRLNGGNRNARS
jgi:NADH dehydrogenase